MTPVESSNIAAIGFDPTGDDKGTLTVAFKNGTLYSYVEVPATTHAELMKAESVGKFFNANVRSKFEVQKLEPEPKPEDEAETDDKPEESK